MSQSFTALSPNLKLDIGSLFLRPVFLGVISIAVLASFVIGWMAFAPVASAVIALGTVVVEGNVRTIQHVDGGIVQSILVRDGDTVVAGQSLVYLDTERQDNLIKSLQANLALLIAREGRLRSELANASTLYIPQGEGGLDLLPFRAIVEDQRRDFEARRLALSLRVRELDNDCEQNIAIISGFQKQLSEMRVRISLSEQDRSAVAELARTGTATQRALREAAATQASLLGEEAGIQARINELASQIGHNKLEIERLTATLHEEDETDLQQVTRDKQDVEQRLRDTQLVVRRADIRAPVDGKVMNLSVHTIGGAIAPNSPILEIVPIGEPLVIEAQVDPVDIDNISIGSPVSVQSVGIGSQRLPKVAGEVSSISPDRIVDKSKGSSYFLIRISIDLKRLNEARGADLRPGVPLTVMIQKKLRSTVWYIFGPFISTFSRALRE